MTSGTPQRIDIVEALTLCDAATAGPWLCAVLPTSIGTCWRVWPVSLGDVPPKHGATCLYDDNTSLNPHKEGEQERNARFISAARTLLPQALKELAEARARLSRIDTYSGSVCEGQSDATNPHGPVEYNEADGVPMCADCWQDALDYMASLPDCAKCSGTGNLGEDEDAYSCDACEGTGKIDAAREGGA